MRVPSPAEVLGGTTRDFITTLEIDTDGDGAFEIESAPGNYETRKVVRSLLEADIDIEPDTINFGSEAIEKSITCYIELPAEFSPEDIDISTILLWGSVPALEKPIDIMDHDKDGILELVVKFDRQFVIDYLLQTKQVEGEVSVIVTGVVNARPFKGVDVISVTGIISKEVNESVIISHLED